MADANVLEEEDSVPDEIHLPCQVFDLSFHPNKDVLASGQIDGTVNIHSYSSTDGNRLLMQLNHHKKACRALTFSSDGLCLYTASKDKSLTAVDMNTGSIAHTIKKAHSCPVYTMKILSDNLLASGDDDGCIKMWDTRSANCIMELTENEDFISDLESTSDCKTLLATSGDGTLSVIDLRQKKLETKSENQESDLLSLAIVKSGRKVVVGGGDGTLGIFSWGRWEDYSDRFPGHPLSVDSMIQLSENVICTGSIDGIIRAVHIFPNRLLGVVGEHVDFPIEQLRLSREGDILASCSHDQKIKFWNVDHLKDIHLDPAATKEQTPNLPAGPSGGFFDDL